MQNQYSRLFIVLFISLAFLAGCNLPQTPTPSVEPPGTLPVEPTTNGTTGTGGGASTEIPGSQNPLPAAVNLQKSSIDLQKLGKDIIGGGGGGWCIVYLEIKTEQKIFLTYDRLPNSWRLCFTNFPVGSALVKLSTQGGMFDTSVNVAPELQELDGYSAYEYSLYVNLPALITRDGPLEVELNVDGATFSQTIDIQTMEMVSIYDDSVRTLDARNLSYPDFNSGEQIQLLGVGFFPSTTVYVGIYGTSIIFNSWEFYPLVDQFEVTTNETGGFLGVVQISEKYHQGEYVIYYGYNSELFENRQNDHKYDKFIVSGTSPTWQPCPADYPSRLRVGDIGIVSDNPPLPNNVRNNPSHSGEKIGQLQPGEQFIILDGPVCNDGWVWWYVQGADDENNQVLTGWTSEGDVKNYWLVPDNPEQPNG